MKRLEGQVAVITGGGSGIGLASARAFLDEGAKVVVTGRGKDRLDAAVATLDAGDRLLAVPTDVSDPEQVHALFTKTTETFGPVDLLVNNAGANLKERTFRELTPERWKLLLGSNLEGAFYCMREVLPSMLERKSGSIIQVNSIAGKRGSPLGGSAYSAAKFGLSGLTSCIAAEECGNGVRFCNIYPGEVNTPILENRPKAVSDEHRASILQPEDVAAAVLFVATMPPHVEIPELIIKPAGQAYV